MYPPGAEGKGPGRAADAREGYVLPSRRPALELVRDSLDNGPILLTGEAGTGKTWLWRHLAAEAGAGRSWIEVDLTPSDDPSAFLRMIGPCDCRTTVVRRHPDGPPPADHVTVVGEDGLAEAVTGADLVVLALALTPSTTGLVDAALLERMGPTCHLVNVARGAHVVTDDLVAALRDGTIASAGLDVTDPEPLPDGHPLWTLPNCTLTPHVGNTPRMAVPLLSARITDNVRRWLGGEELVGLVDVDLGY